MKKKKKITLPKIPALRKGAMLASSPSACGYGNNGGIHVIVKNASVASFVDKLYEVDNFDTVY
jgi:aerobic-type carbon monoxide dehydrogenase small subunit (CoxS/CutS family)